MPYSIFLFNATSEQRCKLEFAFKYFGFDINIENNDTRIDIYLEHTNLDEETFFKIVKYAGVEYSKSEKHSLSELLINM